MDKIIEFIKEKKYYVIAGVIILGILIYLIFFTGNQDTEVVSSTKVAPTSLVNQTPTNSNLTSATTTAGSCVNPTTTGSSTNGTTMCPIVSGGSSGYNGRDGQNGTSGTNGKDGIAGTNGSNGKDGTNGKDGATGPAGPQGPQGPAGEDGQNGVYWNDLHVENGSTYSQSGGFVNYDFEFIGGDTTTGAYNHTGGTNLVNMDLNIANSGGNAWYSLSGESTVLTVSRFEHIGVFGSGYFNQSNGTHTIAGYLVLGGNPTGYGEFNMSGGSLHIGTNLSVGAGGPGSFNHTDGYVVIDDTLGSGYNGIYHLSGGGLSVHHVDADPNDGWPGYLASLDYTGGMLNFDQISGSLDQQATNANSDLYVGRSSRTSTITGDYSMEHSTNYATIDFEIDGNESGVSYDVLDVTGAANTNGYATVYLDGYLQLYWDENFTPGYNDTFDLIIARDTEGEGRASITVGSNFSILDNKPGWGYRIVNDGPYIRKLQIHRIVEKEWLGDTGSWLIDGNWDSWGVPQLTDNVTVPDDVTVGTISGIDNQSINSLGIYNGSNVLQVSGNVAMTEFLDISASGATYTIQGGTLDTPSIKVNNGGILAHDDGDVFADNVLLGELGNLSEYNMQAGTLSVTYYLTVGQAGNADFNQVNGSVNVGLDLVISNDNGLISSGEYNMTDGVLNVGDTLSVGKIGSGAFTQNGGSVEVGEYVILGQSDTGTGTYLMNSGSIDAFGIISGSHGAGEFTQNGGSVTTSRIMLGAPVAGSNEFSDGTYGLNDGTLATKYMEMGFGGGDGYFAMNGGSLRVEGDTPGEGIIMVGDTTLSGGTGSFVLNGGNLRADQIDFVNTEGAGNAQFHFYNGILSVDKFGDVALDHNEDLYQTGGSLNPGDTLQGDGLVPMSGYGTTTVYGNYTLDNSSTSSKIVLDINTLSAGVPIAGTDYDQVDVVANFEYIDGNFELNFIGGVENLNEAYSYNLIHADDIVNNNSWWSHIFTNLPTGWGVEKVAGGSETLQLRYYGSHGAAVSLNIIPVQPVSTTVGGTKSFLAYATDSNGFTWDVTSEVTFYTTDPNGGFTPGNVYNAGTAGSWLVYATWEGYQSNDVDVNVKGDHGVAVSLTIDPTSLDVDAWSENVFTATAHDGNGNSWDVTNQVTWHENDPYGFFNANTYNARTIGGPWTIYASLGSINSNNVLANISGGHGDAVWIELFPQGSLDIYSGNQQDFIVVAHDNVSGGQTWDVTSLATLETDDPTGSFAGNTYTAGTIGSWGIRAFYDTMNTDDVLVNVLDGTTTKYLDTEINTEISPEITLSSRSGQDDSPDTSTLSRNGVIGDYIDGMTGGLVTNDTTWTVITNRSAGFTLSLKSISTALNEGSMTRYENDTYDDSSYFAAYTGGTIANPSFGWTQPTEGNAEFGYTVSFATNTQDVPARWRNCGGGDDLGVCYAPMSNTDNNILESDDETSPYGDLVSVRWFAELTPSDTFYLKDGEFRTTIRATATCR